MYELTAYKILEDELDVVRYENEPFRIEYVIEERHRNCVPDILVYKKDCSRELVEVKPRYKLFDKFERRKIRVIKDYCENNKIRFWLWTEKKLFPEGLDRYEVYKNKK